MSHMPVIRTAIPKRRYQLGSWSVAVLGEVESGDGKDYRFIMAFVEQGGTAPRLFVCSERNRDPAVPGSHSLRVVTDALSEVLETDDCWRDLERFCDQGLRLGCQVLGIPDREPAVRLL